MKFLKKLSIPLLLYIALIIWGHYPLSVEKYYTYGIYNNVIAPALRFLFGWIPFSLGDILYIILALYLLYKVLTFFTKRKWKLIKSKGLQKLGSLLIIILWYNNAFLLLWGLNYSRPGIAYQLQITPKTYSTENIITLVNYHDSVLKSLDTSQILNMENFSFSNCKKLIQPNYNNLQEKYDFINFKYNSTKKSIFSNLGNYMGFLGYLNPFTNEAQINTYTPNFLKPFTTMHEVAHQLGYASESEANLVSYMACMQSNNDACKSAACFEVLLYGYMELNKRDTTLRIEMLKNASPIFLNNYKILVAYHNKYRGVLDKITMWFYDAYLKSNKQSSGVTSYSELTSWLIAYKNEKGVYP